jgi:hypothetical protein
MASYFLGIDIKVRMTSRKVGVKKKAIHFIILSMRNLLETIKRFLKATNKVGVILNIARRLFHVDFFFQIPMQEGIFNIYLMGLPFMRGSKGEYKADGIHFGYGGKGFIIVVAFNLREFFGN